jgi:4-amino-4-deoxy-L-arabinose transferase-like glycosyltransferase
VGTPTLLRVLAAGVALSGIALRLVGLGRSAWLDEAWVANSVGATTWSGMFYYDAWLQTSPPLFLLLERATVGVVGFGVVAVRLMPLAVGVAAMALMLPLSRRLLAPRFALMAWSLLVLSPVAVEYSKTVKQYSMELAATTLVLWGLVRYTAQPTRGRFVWLTAMVAAGLTAAYPMVYFIPSVVAGVVISRGGAGTHVRRALILGAVSAVTLLAVYLVFARPNSSPVLESFWFDASRSLGQRLWHASYAMVGLLPVPDPIHRQQTLVSLVLAAVLGLGVWLGVVRYRHGHRRWLHWQALCGVPILIAVVAHGAGVYPISGRTSLFLLPAFLLLTALCLQLAAHAALRRGPRRTLDRVLTVAVVSAVVLFAGNWVRRPVAALIAPVEDMAAALAFLRANVDDRDYLWVHASTVEGFKLYRTIEPGPAASTGFGRTGWPCCPRGAAVVRGAADAEAVRRDLERGLPEAFTGRVWLLYTTRPEHWRFVGLDESKVMEAVLLERRCQQGTAPTFLGVGVSVFTC